MKFPVCSLLAASCLLALATASATPAWDTGAYTAATFSPLAGNLISGAAPIASSGMAAKQEGTQGLDKLTDGAVPSAAVPAQYGMLCTASSGASVTYSLGDSPVNLTEVRIYSMWKDSGRDQIGISSVEYQTQDGGNWTAIPNSAVSFDQGTFMNRAFLTDSTTGVLAENVAALRINFSTLENGWCGYAEIEAAGVPTSAVPWHTLSLASATTNTATLGGTVGGCAGGTASDIYFAYGPLASAASLVPMLAVTNVAEGADFTLPTITGLFPGTTYAFATYSVSDNGKQSTTATGTFTTEGTPVAASVSVQYAAKTTALLQGVVSNLGTGGSSASFFFAVGTDDSSLVPAIYTNNLAAGETFDIPLAGLSAGTAYAWACYAVNDAGAWSEIGTGHFSTTDGSSPRWLGLVSSNWSDAMNWDSEAAPSSENAIQRLILDYPAGRYAPSNLDIAGLVIRDLRLVSDRNYELTVSGQPFTCHGVSSSGSGYGDITILNDIEIHGFTIGLQNNMTLRLNGTLSSPDVGLTIRNAEPGGSLYLGGTNTFAGRVEGHVGTFYFTNDKAFGADPATLPESPDIQENYSSLHLVNSGERNLEVFAFAPTRRLTGSFYLHDGTEADAKLALDQFVEFCGNGGDVKHVLLDGTALESTGAEFSGQAEINVATDVLLSIGPSFTAHASRGLRTHNATVDFAGRSFTGFLQNYSFGAKEGPNYINSDRGSETVLTGPIRLGYDFNTTFFGGAGDIRVEGDIIQDAAHHFHKSGQGRLTLAGESLTWSNSSEFSGDTTLDYRTHNTSKLGNPAVTMRYGDLHIAGNASAPTACELSTLTLGGGLVTLSTDGGAGLSLSPTKISGFARDRAIDFQLDANTTLAFSDATFANNTKLGAMNAGATWNHGSAFAYLNGDGTVGPLPAASLDATLADHTIWHIGAGTTTVSSGWHHPVGLFLDGAGDTTVVVEGGIDIESDGSACPILVSSACGGDIFFTNGTIKSQNDNRGIVIHNWNTNGVLRISSVIPETNDNDFMIAGPGTTLLDNDANSFYYGPHLHGGGTVRFTSIADRGTSSALGKGRNDYGNINIGHGCTYEYVGTAPEGHASNRRLTLIGDVTIKANGAGPLTLNNTTAIAGGIATSRAILDGDGEGVITGAVSPGRLGSVVKRGTGTWTLSSTDSSYEYPTEVEEGTLVLAGALPSSAIVHENGTLALASGAVVKRHLSSDGTLRFNVGDDPESFEPANVWGRAEINGSIALDRRPAAGVDVPLLAVGNGLSGTYEPESPHVRLVMRDGVLYARSGNAATIVIVQ